MLRSTVDFVIMAAAIAIIGMAEKSTAQTLPRVEWLGCIETFTRKPTLSSEAFPNMIVVGLVNRCPEQVVGLICVEDVLTRSWSAWHGAGRRVDPGGTLQVELHFPEEYAKVNTLACYEDSVCNPDTVGWGCSTLGGN